MINKRIQRKGKKRDTTEEMKEKNKKKMSVECAKKMKIKGLRQRQKKKKKDTTEQIRKKRKKGEYDKIEMKING